MNLHEIEPARPTIIPNEWYYIDVINVIWTIGDDRPLQMIGTFRHEGNPYNPRGPQITVRTAWTFRDYNYLTACIERDGYWPYFVYGADLENQIA